MITTVQCIILLVCVSMCTSQVTWVDSSHRVVRVGCQCVKTSKAVTLSRIADLQIYEPRLHCNKKEIIAVLRGAEGLSETCLDPDSKFVQALERTYLIQKRRLAAQENRGRQKRATM